MNEERLIETPPPGRTYEEWRNASEETREKVRKAMADLRSRQPFAQLQPLAPATQISRCCKAPVWKDGEVLICNKCRTMTKAVEVEQPQTPSPHPDSPYPSDPGMMPPCLKEPQLGPYTLPLRSGQPAVLLTAGVPLADAVRFEIPPLPETLDPAVIKKWFEGIVVRSPGGGLTLSLKAKHYDVEQRS